MRQEKSGWIGRATVAGTTGGLAAGIVFGLGYLFAFESSASSRTQWAELGLSLWAYSVLTGALFGLAACGAVRVADRCLGRAGWRLRAAARVTAASIGGALSGLLPGYLAATVFGSQSLPYPGSTETVGTYFLGTTIVVALCSASEGSRLPSSLAGWARAVFGSVVSVGAVAILGWAIVDACGGLPDLAWLRHARDVVGLGGLGTLAGATVGAAVGLAFGLCTTVTPASS